MAYFSKKHACPRDKIGVEAVKGRPDQELLRDGTLKVIKETIKVPIKVGQTKSDHVMEH